MNPRLLAALALLVGLAACATRPPADTAATSATDEVELIPRELLFSDPAYVRIRISPDGRHLSWIAPLDGVANLWVAPADDPGRARAVTRDSGRGIGWYFWSYRPGTVLYVQDSGGDENFRIHAVDVDSGTVRALTPPAYIFDNALGLSHRHADTLVVGLNDRDPRWQDLYAIDLASGERRLLERNDHSISRFHLDDDLQPRLGLRSRTDGGSDVLARTADGDWQRIDDIPFADSLTTGFVRFTGDGDHVYQVDSRQRDVAALYRIDLRNGDRTLVFENPRADLGLNDILFHPTTGQAQAVEVNHLQREWKVLDDDVAVDIAVLEREIRGASVVARTLADDRWIVADHDSRRPWNYFLYRREDRTLTRLFSIRPALDGKPLVAMWPQTIRSRDGLDLVSYLTLPRDADPDADGAAETPVPMVLLVHGGPWARDEYDFNSEVQWLANRGYAVLQVNFRGSTGFGKAFVNAADGEWGARMHDDLIDAMRWAVDRGVTREDTVAIMGASYGGYATLVGLTLTPERFRCGVNIVGVSNLDTAISSIPPYWTALREQFLLRVGDPGTNQGRAMLAERSPISHVNRIVRPLLIGHGSNDPRVKQVESDQIVTATRTRNIPVTYALFPDEGHGFARPQNSKAFYALTEGFLGQCLGGRVEPIGDALNGSSLVVDEGADLIPGLPEALATHEPVSRR